MAKPTKTYVVDGCVGCPFSYLQDGLGPDGVFSVYRYCTITYDDNPVENTPGKIPSGCPLRTISIRAELAQK